MCEYIYKKSLWVRLGLRHERHSSLPSFSGRSHGCHVFKNLQHCSDRGKVRERCVIRSHDGAFVSSLAGRGGTYSSSSCLLEGIREKRREGWGSRREERGVRRGHLVVCEWVYIKGRYGRTGGLMFTWSINYFLDDGELHSTLQGLIRILMWYPVVINRKIAVKRKGEE